MASVHTSSRSPTKPTAGLAHGSHAARSQLNNSSLAAGSSSAASSTHNRSPSPQQQGISRLSKLTNGDAQRLMAVMNDLVTKWTAVPHLDSKKVQVIHSSSTSNYTTSSSSANTGNNQDVRQFPFLFLLLKVMSSYNFIYIYTNIF